MTPKQNPFSLYDFLGYFVPGALFLYGYLAIAEHARGGTNIWTTVPDAWKVERADVYIPFVIAAYVLGHLLNFLSSVIVERYSVWSVGYPSKYLLRHPHHGYFLRTKNAPMLTALGPLILAVVLLPVSLLDFFLGRHADLRKLYAGELDPLLSGAITTKVDRLIADHAGQNTTRQQDGDFFRYAYHYAVENAPNHLPKMQNYVALYGFLRTLTLIAVMFFWVVAWHAFKPTLPWTEKATLIVATMALAYVLFMAFSKFYRRFSLEALMALAVTYPATRR